MNTIQKNNLTLLCGLMIFFIAAAIRLYGLHNNDPFWIDEFSTARNAHTLMQYGLGAFLDKSVYIEYHNILLHGLVALSYSLYGMSEYSTRLPIAFVGSIVPVLLFFTIRYIFPLQTALAGSLLLSFSYFHIAYSRQARSYIIVEACVLISTFFYFKILNSKKISSRDTFFLGLSLLIGILSHALFWLFIIAFILHALYNLKDTLRSIVRKPLFLVGLASILVLISGRVFDQLNYFLNAGVFGTNNLWYYHAFLWREYGLISFLCIIGILIGIKTKRRETLFVLLYALINVIFIMFIFKPYVSRYLLPLWPFIIAYAAYAVGYLCEVVFKNWKITSKQIIFLAPILICTLIVANGEKFILKPQIYYSVNHDFREIALIDYHQVYAIMKNKGGITRGEKPAIIDTWGDRTYWYLGYDYEPIYMFKWMNASGTINGLTKETTYKIDTAGQKYIPETKYGFVGELSDLKNVMKKYPKGFIFIDDSSLPADVINYAKKNLKKELYLDHYPLDDNPYSQWPATLYSWGYDSQ